MEKPNQKIIQKFIDNQCSEAEYNLMMEYLNSLDDNELKLFLDSHIKQIDALGITKLDEYDGNFDSIISAIKPVKKQHTFFRRKYTYSIAASIVFLLLLSTTILYYFGIFNSKPNEIIWSENKTQMGQKLILSLPDGSDITLNGDSKLRYPQEFEFDFREVYLEGEAFFDVVHDSSKPFIVYSGNLTTTVLGTKFNVNAFKNSNEISVSLVNGKVMVTNKEMNGIKGKVLLAPQQKLVYNIKDDFSKVKEFDLIQEVGWKYNVLIFKDEPLNMVFTRLERAYGIKFELQSKYNDNIKITTKFENSTLITVNEVIKKLTGLEYKSIADKNVVTKVIFYKKKK